MLTAPSSPVPHRHAPDLHRSGEHDHGHPDHDHGSHENHDHDHAHDHHTHSHDHAHGHAHAAPRARKAKPASIRSLMALSGGQRLLLVLPLLGGLWLATFWAMN